MTLHQLQNIAKNFQINSKIITYQAIHIGHINQTYRITCSNEDYILQNINTQIFPKPHQIMENVVQAAAILKGKNYPKKILEPIATRHQKYLHKDTSNQYWRLYPFFQNTHSIHTAKDANTAYQAAFTFGEYINHLNTADLIKFNTIIPDFHNTPLRFQQFKKTLHNASEEKKEIAKKEIEWLLNQKQLLNAYHHFNHIKRLVHYDTKINNLLMDKTSGQFIAVIDLDTLMPGLLPYDFGDLIRTCATNSDENETDLEKVFIQKEWLKAIKSGFLDTLDNIHPIEKANLDHGATLIIYEQALRFLSDYLNGNIYYQVNYEDQNLDRAKNQITLLKSY